MNLVAGVAASRSRTRHQPDAPPGTAIGLADPRAVGSRKFASWRSLAPAGPPESRKSASWRTFALTNAARSPADPPQTDRWPGRGEVLPTGPHVVMMRADSVRVRSRTPTSPDQLSYEVAGANPVPLYLMTDTDETAGLPSLVVSTTLPATWSGAC